MDDTGIVAALHSGNFAAIEELSRAYGNRLLRSAYLLCGNEPDSQDLVQDTWIQVIKSIHRFRGDSSLYSWIYGILLNLSRHYHRARKRLQLDHDLDSHPASTVQAETNHLDMEMASSILMNALRQLSPPHREIIVLRYYEGMKVEAIARRLGVSTGTVKSRLHYATKCLRAIIPEHLNLFGSQGTYI